MDINNILTEKCNNKIVNIQIISYSDISINKNMTKPIKYKILEKNKIDKKLFEEQLLNYKLDWSIEGKSDVIIGNILYKDFLGLLEFFFEKIMELDFMPMRKSSSIS
jgi:hypothetical protein